MLATGTLEAAVSGLLEPPDEDVEIADMEADAATVGWLAWPGVLL